MASQRAEAIHRIATGVIDLMQGDKSDATATEMLLGIGSAYLAFGRTLGHPESHLIGILAQMCAAVRRREVSGG